MKTKIYLIVALMVGFMGLQAGWAAEKAEAVKMADAAIHTLTYGEKADISGVIEKSDSGLLLISPRGRFMLKGDAGLEKLAGKPVEVRGVLEKGAKYSIILVEEAKVVK